MSTLRSVRAIASKPNRPKRISGGTVFFLIQGSCEFLHIVSGISVMSLGEGQIFTSGHTGAPLSRSMVRKS